ncbi:pre-toxin TG domain-containing protein [Lactiplantibacillus pentosus]|nr:pre-toxin TG domain-containing protein [Lactiplantibacillus pentosus]WFC04298.1 pre-toxin TG domain-containing protein [Lactiplantibacillus pentosus]
MIGYNDIYTMITGKDAATGKKRSRLVGAAWTALNFVPVSKVAKLAKATKLLATANKAEKVVKNGGRVKRAGRATKQAMKRAAEKLAKRKPARKTTKKAPTKSHKTTKTKHKTKKQQKRFNKKKAAGKARKASHSRKKGGNKKKPGKRKGGKAKAKQRKAENKAKAEQAQKASSEAQKASQAAKLRAVRQAKNEATRRAGNYLVKHQNDKPANSGKPKVNTKQTHNKPTKSEQKQYNKNKAARQARKNSHAQKKGGKRKTPAKRKPGKAKAKSRSRIGKVHLYKYDESVPPNQRGNIRNHIYKNTEGHFPTWSQEHDDTLLRVARRKANFKRMDIFGNDWYAETTKDHKQIWVRVRDGRITDGGINSRPVPVMKDGMHKVPWYEKNGVKLP